MTSDNHSSSPKSSTWKYILLAIGIFIIFIILVMNCVFYKQLIDDGTAVTCSGSDNSVQLFYWANIFMTIISAILFIILIIMIAMPNTYKSISQYANTPIHQNSAFTNSFYGNDTTNPQNSLIKNNLTGSISSVPTTSLANYGIMTQQKIPTIPQ